ncbi:tyrosine-type recombinase/integrase [Sporosarcina sp. FSL K6-1508]
MPHTLRHCTATHLTKRNVAQHTIASILGHADLS